MDRRLLSYSVVTGSYWLFMLTDGALRMLVLLYFHNLGYSPLTLAFLFLLYEFFGIITNLFGGWIAQRKGLKFTLIVGLTIQPLALLSLSFLNNDWLFTIPFIMLIQALSGIAKDFTKMSSKTAVKFLIPQNKGTTLFKWVSVLTGSKNAIKGFGFFLGGFLLSTIGFKKGLYTLAILVFVALILSLFLLPQNLGERKSNFKLKNMFKQKRSINILSSARVFLFASRDIWFVVSLPVYFSTVLGWNHEQVGGFMAFWVIGYGVVQGITPKILSLLTKKQNPTGKTALQMSVLLAMVMIFQTTLFFLNIFPTIIITYGIILFGIVFALNSSVHSFLILDYADGDKAASNVGFYYMANAIGRLIGTLLSGLLFQFGGVTLSLLGSGIFLIITSMITKKLPNTIPSSKATF